MSSPSCQPTLAIREDDRVIGVRLTNGENEIIIANRNGRAIRFHESKVQEMTAKYESLPKDIEWHFIGFGTIFLM